MTNAASLPDRLRKYVLRLPDDHKTKRLCLEAAAALDRPATLCALAQPRDQYCFECGETSYTVLDVCPECSAPL